MTHPNASWLFYKAYYQDFDFSKSKPEDKRGKELEEGFFRNANERLLRVELPATAFDPLDGTGTVTELVTTYPGLLIGSGYQHETGRLGEFKLGFFFDHSSGLPIIPGSSIKGMLRSCFREPELIRHYLNNQSLDVKALEMDIFEGKRYDEEKKAWLPKPMREHDTFFDAFPVNSTNGKDRRLFDPDFITPHNPTLGEMRAFKDPIPVAFLKVRAGIVYRFRFELHNSPGANAGQKQILFSSLIRDFGLGAKTNVGYGHFVEAGGQQGGPEGSGQPERRVGELDQLEELTFAKLKTAQKRGAMVQGLVRDNQNGQLTVELRYEGGVLRSVIPYNASANIPVNALVNLKVTDPGNPDRKVAARFSFGGFVRK